MGCQDHTPQKVGTLPEVDMSEDDMSEDPDYELADLPEDLLSGSIYPLLPAYSLRAAAATSNSWRRALIQAPAAVRGRASWRHGWTETGAGASRHPVDFAVCAADGSWHPGGAALASSLHFSVGEDVGFRLIIEEVALCGRARSIPAHAPCPEAVSGRELGCARGSSHGHHSADWRRRRCS